MIDKPALLHRLSAVEYFTFGFGTMVGVGWLSACIAWLLRVDDEPRWPACLGAVVAVALIAMKVLPFVPGSFIAAEWISSAGGSRSGGCSGGTRRLRAQGSRLRHDRLRAGNGEPDADRVGAKGELRGRPS